MKKNNKAKVIASVVAVAVIAIVLSVVFAVQLYGELSKPTEFETVEPASGEGTGYYRHCYEALNDAEKKFYSAVIQSIYTMPEKIEVPSLADGDFNRVFEALSFDNPDLFCLGRTSSAYAEGEKVFFEPEYVITPEEYAKQLSELNAAVDSVIAQAQSCATVFDREIFVHDYIVNHCVYTDPDNYLFANDAYGCLVGGQASCEGYSRAFQLIMNRMNVDVRLVTGEAADNGIDYIGHMWNYVIIDNKGYFVDVTWDDPRAENAVPRHAYFNVNTADILLKHRNIIQTLPMCVDREYNYFIHENAFFAQGKGENFEQTVSSAVAASRQRGYNSAELRFADANSLELAKHTLFEDGAIYNVYLDAGIVTDGNSAQVYYSSDKSLLTLTLFF